MMSDVGWYVAVETHGPSVRHGPFRTWDDAMAFLGAIAVAAFPAGTSIFIGAPPRKETDHSHTTGYEGPLAATVDTIGATPRKEADARHD